MRTGASLVILSLALWASAPGAARAEGSGLERFLAEAAKRPVEPAQQAPPRRQISRFCYSLGVPADWKDPESEQTAWRFALIAPGQLRAWPVLLEVRIGTPASSYDAARFWMEGPLFAAAGEAIGGVLESKVHSYETRVGEGASVAWMSLVQKREGVGSAWTGHLLRAMVYSSGGFTLFAGSVWNPSLVGSEAELEAEYADFQRVAAQLVDIDAKYQMPPANAQWTAWLTQKRRYLYYYESSFSTSSGYALLQLLRDVRFQEDGRCTVLEKKHSEVSTMAADPQGLSARYEGFGPRSAAADGSESARCEVRGQNDHELWLVTYRPNELTTFHPLGPQRTHQFGTQSIQGTSIDGYIEGKYFVGNDYRYYEPPGY